MKSLPGCLAYTAIIAAFFWLAATLFDYNLMCIIGKDVPWYADLAGGIVLNAVNLPVAVLLWIGEMCGASYPLFPMS
jgi:hypothetical protein